MPSESEPRPAVILHPATARDLADLQAGDDSFERRTGWRVVPGWCSFDGVLDHSAAELGRGVPAEWSTQLFLVREADGSTIALVGVGGFKGPPDDGAVEIGYEIAPARRGHGLATAAARALIATARAAGVTTVLAHTLAEPNPSTSVLTRLGFERTEVLDDPDEGAVWRWDLRLRR